MLAIHCNEKRDCILFSIKLYAHFSLSFHFCPPFLLLLLLLLVQGTSLAQGPTKYVDALGWRGGSFSAGRDCGRPGTRAWFSASVPFRFPGFRPLFWPLPIPGPRPRPASLLAVLAAFRVFGPGRAATPRAAHVDYLRLPQTMCLVVDMCSISTARCLL